MDELERIRLALRELSPELRARWGIRVVGIFGSLVRGEASPESDVDILVEVERPIGLEFVTAAAFLEERLRRRVDLASRRALRPSLLEVIERELVHA